jgi:hypothetical protein
MSEIGDMERMRVLERIERGEISAADGMALLEALAARAAPVVVEPAYQAGGDSIIDPDIARFKRWWTLPFAIGTAIMVLAAMLMLPAIQAAGYGFWFYCLWLPSLLGVAVMAIAWASRTARWLHVRVQTGRAAGARAWPRRIAISFPIPVRFTAWLVRTISPHVPQLRNTALDELILALNDPTSSKAPLYVDVAEGEGGERIQVYLG